MIDTLSFISLNVNGLRNDASRLDLFAWLKQSRYDIIFLQDIHFLPSDQALWDSQWGAAVVWSPFNAILSLNRAATLSLVDTPLLPDRLLVVTITFPGVAPLQVASVYVPAQRGERRAFLNSLPDNPSLELDILAGDINMIADPSIDKRLVSQDASLTD